MLNEQLEILESMKEYLDKLDQGILDLGARLKVNVTPKERHDLNDVIEGIEWLIGAFRIIENTLQVKIDIQKINPLLLEMMEAIENDDMILLADLLEYEFTEFIKEWKEVIESILR